ncbi:hypothetical protein ABCJ02_002494 [Salmonella enterica]
MKNVCKYTVLAAFLGVMGSSAAMAADLSGAPIGNNSGTVTLTGNVQATTCALEWPVKDSAFDLSVAKLAEAAYQSTLLSVDQSFTLNHCNNQPVAMNLKAGVPAANNSVIALPDGYNETTTPFYIDARLTTVDNIKYESGIVYDGGALGMDGSHGVVITPTADSSEYTVKNIIRSGLGHDKATAGKYVTTYTYEMTYK